jgi:hypothetical protein
VVYYKAWGSVAFKTGNYFVNNRSKSLI